MTNSVNIWRVLDYCDDCPFKDRKLLHISSDRLNKIKKDLDNGGNFLCHKTVYPEEFNKKPVGKRMCYGAYVYLKQQNKPNQIMQVAERMGIK